MRGDWKAFRPAIWLGMLGIALLLLIAPAYIGGAVMGFAIGIAIRVEGRRRQPQRARRRRRKRGGGPARPR
jgi:hypothetical protein